MSQQWVVDAYLLTLSALLLTAGGISDRLGRGRVLVGGLLVFGGGTLACAFAPGPVIGGVLVDGLGWRSVFLVTVACVLVALPLVRTVPMSRSSGERPPFDALGSVLAVLAAGGVVSALIEQGRVGWGHPLVIVAGTVGVVGAAALVAQERHAQNPIVPLHLLVLRDFLVGNVATAFIYGAVGLMGFAVTLFVEQVWDLPATLAGVAGKPPTVLLMVLSGRVARISSVYGPRIFMGGGPILSAAGMLLMLATSADERYWTTMLPGLLLVGLGFAIMVAPLTSVVLDAVPGQDAGAAAALNNAVSRVAGLVMVALVGTIAGGRLDTGGFHRILLVMAALLLAAVWWVSSGSGADGDEPGGGRVPVGDADPVRPSVREHVNAPAARRRRTSGPKTGGPARPAARAFRPSCSWATTGGAAASPDQSAAVAVAMVVVAVSGRAARWRPVAMAKTTTTNAMTRAIAPVQVEPASPAWSRITPPKKEPSAMDSCVVAVMAALAASKD
nr:MFS transporter [Curtobacterium sp. MCBD17_034]